MRASRLHTAYDNELHHRIRTMRYKPSPVSKHMLARFTGSYLRPEGRPGFLGPVPQGRPSWVSSVYSSGGGSEDRKPPPYIRRYTPPTSLRRIGETTVVGNLRVGREPVEGPPSNDQREGSQRCRGARETATLPSSWLPSSPLQGISNKEPKYRLAEMPS